MYLHALTAAEEWQAAEEKRDRVGGLVIVLFTPRGREGGASASFTDLRLSVPVRHAVIPLTLKEISRLFDA